MAAGSHSLRILLVDDHEESLSAMARLLKISGYEVHTATTFADALTIASRQPCDLLISDLGLPDRTGLDLLGEVRAMYPLKGIALTGYAEEHDVRQTTNAGFARHLTKPVDFTALLAAIKDVASDPT